MAVLPDLKNFFLPPCISGERAGTTSGTNVQSCLVSSINYYIEKLTIITAIISFVYILIAGYQMFTAFGDESKFAQAKKTLVYAIAGFLISLLARFVVYIFVNALGGSNSLIP